MVGQTERTTFHNIVCLFVLWLSNMAGSHQAASWERTDHFPQVYAPAFALVDPTHPKRNDHKKHIISNLVNDARALNTYAVIFFDTRDYTKSSLMQLHATLSTAAISADQAADDAEMSDSVAGGNVEGGSATATGTDHSAAAGAHRVQPRRSLPSQPPPQYNLQSDSD